MINSMTQRIQTISAYFVIYTQKPTHMSIHICRFKFLSMDYTLLWTWYSRQKHSFHLALHSPPILRGKYGFQLFLSTCRNLGNIFCTGRKITFSWGRISSIWPTGRQQARFLLTLSGSMAWKCFQMLFEILSRIIIFYENFFFSAKTYCSDNTNTEVNIMLITVVTCIHSYMHDIAPNAFHPYTEMDP